MLGAVVRKDYEDRRHRQSEGIAQAKASGKYKGRTINPKLHETIKVLLTASKSYNDNVSLLGCHNLKNTQSDL